MSALTAPRNTDAFGNGPVVTLFQLPVAANAILFPGAIVCVNASGFCVPASTSTSLVALGRCDNTLAVDNTGGSNGDLTVMIRPGTYSWVNSAGVDAVLSSTPLGANLYLVDDQTVALTDGQGTRSFAGRLAGLDTVSASAPGVFVTMDYFLANAGAVNPKVCISLPVTNSAIANGVVETFTPSFAGRIAKLHYVVNVPVTTGAKLSNIAASIAGTPVTGGVLALTSAAMTPAGAEIISSAITALNSFSAGQAITLVASSTTSFVEGTGTFIIELA